MFQTKLNQMFQIPANSVHLFIFNDNSHSVQYIHCRQFLFEQYLMLETQMFCGEMICKLLENTIQFNTPIDIPQLRTKHCLDISISMASFQIIVFGILFAIQLPTSEFTYKEYYGSDIFENFETWHNES